MNNRSYETLLYSITASVTNRLVEMNNWSEDEALEKFTTSKLYTYLEKEETKVWQYSALMLAILLNDEIEGHVVLPEV
jgi:phosphoribosyl-AMP cyclohydrolase